MRDVYIVSYARTPIGAFQGTLSSVNACELGGIAIKGTFIITKSISQKLAAVERAGLHELTAIDDVLMGNVISAGLGQAPGSTAARLGGLPNCIPASTVNKVCASGMKAIMLAASSIRCGAADIIIAGGMESMSQAPHLLNIRKGAKYGDQSVIDSLRFDGLTDAATNVAMGLCGEKCASDYGITREASDEYAKKTYERAIEFASKVAKEIVPVSIPAGKGKFNMIDADETPKNVSN
jgi:acetyl-CoA C-acetyltransferase